MRKILAAGALPIVIGGDHAIPIPVLRAYEGRGPDHAGADRRAHRLARGRGRRARGAVEPDPPRLGDEPYRQGIFQIGIRAQGSARPEEVEAALAYGANIITAYELHDVGMDAVLARIPDGGNYYITIDADGMDPAAMPAVGGPGAGRRHLRQARKLIHGLVKKGRVVGMDIVEITPRSTSTASPASRPDA